ncbi:MAG: hypothetical protein ABH859_04245 [Pseudomonadota bacterium]
MGGDNKKRALFWMLLCLFLLVPVLAGTQQGQPNTKEDLSGLDLGGFEQVAEDGIKWRNNPFIQPADDVALDELKLTGIVYNPDDAAVIINDRIIKKGEQIGFNTIVEITNDFVILRNETGLFRLSLGSGGNEAN